MRKRTFLFTIIFIISYIFPISTNAVSFNPSLDIYSEAAYMVNLNTGQVVYKKNENKQLHPASLTKIMTAILLLEQYKDNPEALKTTYVSAPSTAYNDFYGQDVSNADIKINEKVSYNDLLYALLVRSACESANIIAYNIGDKNIASFVEKMNKKAQELGATNTHFENAHGLENPAQVTTAHDIAIITQYAMKFPKFMEVACTPKFTMEVTPEHPAPRTYKHTNAMLDKDNKIYYYEPAKGIKTGTLDEAGLCLVSTATQNGQKYLIATLNAPIKDAQGNNKFYNCLDHTTLYKWAFEKLEYKKLLDDKKEVGEVSVEYGKDVNHVNLKPSQEFSTIWTHDAGESAIKQKVITEDSVIAPVKEGQKLGKLELIYNGETIFTTDLVAVNSVQRDTLKYKLNVAKQFKSSKMMKIAILSSLGIFVFYSALYIIFVAKKSRKKTFKPKRSGKKFKVKR